MLFSQWLGCLSLPSVFFSQQFLILCFFWGGAQWIMSFIQVCTFSTRFSQQEKESIEKNGWIVRCWRTGFRFSKATAQKSPWVFLMGFDGILWSRKAPLRDAGLKAEMQALQEALQKANERWEMEELAWSCIQWKIYRPESNLFIPQTPKLTSFK